ncbi:hypothetical protein DEM26_19565 [Thioclava sp. NG1]|uniref:glycosyltransferase family 25 protein n=1 Tax=Thioclava sp. NG1 TaxID=2182426 RepID=UPI000D617093|nr:glycosyltransferase family 25 protein [Thioclava sp. NG1]PWE48178.1 hypothetical protein DEM26_19565 [Thioclava sp. NG1]
MSPKIAFYVINLDKSQNRFAEFSNKFSPFSCKVERIPGVDGSCLGIDQFTDDERCRKEMGRSIQPGEVGCYLSHKKALQHFIASTFDYVVVLEDDAVPASDFVSTVEEVCSTLHHLRDDIFAINIGATDFKYSTDFCDVMGRKLKCAHRFPMLATGIIWTRRGALEFLSQEEPIYMPFDNFLRFLFSGTNRAFSIAPPLISTSGASSDIEAMNLSTRRSAQNRSRLYFILKQRRILREKFRALFACFSWRTSKNKIAINKAKP